MLCHFATIDRLIMFSVMKDGAISFSATADISNLRGSYNPPMFLQERVSLENK